MADIDRDEIIMSLTEIADQPTEDGVVGGVNQRTIKGALGLLKEQEPVKVTHLHGTKVTMHEEIVFTDECGYCSGYLLKPWKACPICGRMLKWDEGQS